MESEQENIALNLETVLKSFLNPNFKPINRIYFEKLIEKLSTDDNDILSNPFIVDWVIECVNLLTEDFTQVHPQVVAFLFYLTKLLLGNQWVVLTLQNQNILAKLIELINNHGAKFDVTVKISVVRYVNELSKCSFGYASIISSSVWEKILDYCVHNSTIYLAREARECLFNLIFNMIVKSKDESKAKEVLQKLVNPLYTFLNQNKTLDTLLYVDDSQKWAELESSIDLITCLLEFSIESNEKIIFLKYLSIENNSFVITTWKLLYHTTSNNYISKLIKVLSAYMVLELLETEWNGTDQLSAKQFEKFGVNFYNIVRTCLSFPSHELFLNCTRYYFILWRKLGTRAPAEVVVENELISFSKLIIMFHLVPTVSYLYNERFFEMEDDECNDSFLMQLFQVKTEHGIRLIYDIRDTICRKDGKTLIEDMPYKSINSIISLINILEREQAVFVFQALMIIFRHISLTFSKEAEDITANEHVNILYATLVCIETLIRKFHITWKESIESTSLVTFVLCTLKRSMSTRLCVQFLRVLQLSIENFMAPNMVLLIDDLSDSSLSFLGPLLVKYLHDPKWEIRDSTLELVNSVTQISRIKFPAFQKDLLKYKLFSIVRDIAKHDCEAFVRASAYNCLASMVSVDSLWLNQPNTNELIEHLISVMYNESEGVVRMQAVNTMTKIVEKRKIPPQYDDLIYSIYTYLVVSDLHWEVT